MGLRKPKNGARSEQGSCSYEQSDQGCGQSGEKEREREREKVEVEGLKKDEQNSRNKRIKEQGIQKKNYNQKQAR